MQEKKKGLVIIYDPHSLQQFVWYYCTVSKDKKWDALCLPNGYKGTYMTSYCKKAGIFDRVISDDTDFMNMSLAKKLKLFAMMTGYFLVGQRRKCCKRLLNKFVGDIDNYDELVAICETGFVSGLFALLGKEKTVAYLDDGLGEYLPRTMWSNTFKKSSFIYWQSLFLSRMGYSCKGRFYFKPTKYCYKYSCSTSAMKYKNYKAMYDFDMQDTDVELYNEILAKTYPEIKEINFDNIDSVFFTDNLECFSSKCFEFYNQCTEYISEKSKSVLIKRHPRDNAEYCFDPSVKITEAENEIPAELILPFLKGKKLYFSHFSSIIIFMQQYKYKYCIMYSKRIYKDNQAANSGDWNYASKSKTEEYCKKFSKNSYQLIEFE